MVNIFLIFQSHPSLRDLYNHDEASGSTET